ncbi:unnamed protein product [Spodoptera littoralis]|uniref:Major facilitator superfamily (MFS) profile domain-containing protein n=1 Tax=Spodoptera littoralis TaxID=7109 RepID=A0A9P0HUS6_SPOLI|nr:unnamed protein product [Spodoptera littoralis]CAH1635708.1 unnamed protein product [Spodoptera littoralis]
MSGNHYTGVKSVDEEVEEVTENVKISWTPFLRQLFVVGGVWTIYFVLGLCYGAPNVIIPQIRRDVNSTEAVSEDMASWLSSIHGYAALPWILILPILSRRFGRKVPFVILCINTLIGYVVFYFSTSTIILLISEIMQGMLISSNMTLLILVVTEYTSPRYRGIFMTVKSTIFFWGVWIANATGTFSHWKNIAIIAFVCATLSLTSFFWPESPSWLAMNGRFEECAESHHWLKGYDKDSEKELENLIQSQKEYIARCKKKEVSSKRLKNIIETISTKAFYKPLLLSMTVMSLYNFSGKFVCSMYSIELIKKITKSESTAYTGMLILEAVTIFSMQIGCVLSKYLKRRTLLLSSSSIGIMFLFIISLYLYLIKLCIVSENKIVSLFLLTSFSMTISCGPMILACSVYGELTPLRYRSSSLPTLAIFSEILMASILKVSPYIFKYFELHGAFLFYGVTASVFAFLLYKYLPESKDKTLQEIECYFLESKKSEEVSEELVEEREKR